MMNFSKGQACKVVSGPRRGHYFIVRDKFEVDNTIGGWYGECLEELRKYERQDVMANLKVFEPEQLEPLSDYEVSNWRKKICNP